MSNVVFDPAPYALHLAALFSVLFVLPFVDFRRPLRLLHLDLLALLGFAVPDLLYRSGSPLVALSTFLLLAYLLARMLYEGFRRARRASPLLPFISPWVLAVALVPIAAVRVAANLDADVIDVGYASVVGADRIQHGQSLYEGDFPPLVRPGYPSGHGDTYGPATYLAYVPFEVAFPWSGRWDDLPAAHAASIGFDALTIVALLLLGRRLRRGRAGTELGVVLAYLWATYPYSLLGLVYNVNDGLVAALLVLTLVGTRLPLARGALLGIAAAAKAFPAALVLVVATGPSRRPRSAVAAAVAFVAVAAGLLLPFLPDGGLDEVYDRTVGFQAGRESGFTVWSAYGSLEPLQRVTQAGAIALAFGLALWPRRRDTAQLAALAAAVILALQLAHAYWFVLYIVWWAPLVMAAVVAPHVRGGTVRRAAAPDAADSPLRIA